MRGKTCIASLLATFLLFASAAALSQGERSTLIINGRSTHVPVIQENGQLYVGLDALADAVHGSLSYAGNRVALSVPISSGKSGPSERGPAASGSAAQGSPSNPGFSREFLNAGIEAMSSLREWHAALATAIQNGIPLSSGLLAPYRAQATTDLHLTSVAAGTSSDRSAYLLLNNAFQKMARLSDNYLNLRSNLSYIAPDALQKDDLNQRLVACGHSLGAMVASGQLVADGSCD